MKQPDNRGGRSRLRRPGTNVFEWLRRVREPSERDTHPDQGVVYCPDKKFRWANATVSRNQRFRAPIDSIGDQNNEILVEFGGIKADDQPGLVVAFVLICYVRVALALNRLLLYLAK